MEIRVKTAIILNGMPNTGKDAVANMTDFVHLRFKSHLVKLALAISGVDPVEWEHRYDIRELKEAPWDQLPFNMSQRQFLIYVSEEVIKPKFGKDYFGKFIADKIDKAYDGVFIFSDGGFVEEVEPLAKVVDHIYIVRLTRTGCSWGSDSRGYINSLWDNSTLVHLSNDRPLNLTVKALYEQTGVK